MGTALDDVAFLALSRNRIALLEALTDGDEHTRDELLATTDVSRPTLARILDDLEERAWIDQYGQRCRITHLGAWVYEEFADLLETMATAGTLRDVIRWFPTEDVDLEVLRRLGDAELVLATESDPLAPIRRACTQLRSATHLRFLTTQVTVWYFDALVERVRDDGLAVEGVLTPAAYETLVTTDALATACRTLVETGDVELSVADEVPYVLQVVDDRVGIGLVDETTAPRGIVCTDDDAVAEWAETAFETYRRRADRRLPADPERARRAEEPTGVSNAR